jgi:3-oxoacyl-[acyl-carrier protein] reductase
MLIPNYSRLLEGKVAVVTGTRKPRGFGAAISTLFAQHGAKVAMLNRGPAPEVLDRVITAGSEDAQNIQVDLVNEAQVRRAISTVNSRFGGIDIIINNAGIADFNTAITADLARWHEVIDAKLLASQLVVQESWPFLREDGRIVNIASLAGRFGAAMAACAYTAANAGLVGLAKDWAKKGKSKRVRSNVIAPGPGATDMLDGASPEKLQGMKDSSLVGDICQSSDIANVCLFLCSDMGRMATGICVDLNGGMWIPA